MNENISGDNVAESTIECTGIVLGHLGPDDVDTNGQPAFPDSNSTMFFVVLFVGDDDIYCELTDEEFAQRCTMMESSIFEGLDWGIICTTDLIAEYPELADGDPPYNLTGHPYLRKLFIYNGSDPDEGGANADPDEGGATADPDEGGDKADLDEGSVEADPEDYFEGDTDSEGERERDLYECKPKKITGIKDKLANLPCEASQSGKLFIGLEYASDSEEDENNVINPPLKEALSMGDNMEKQTKMNKNSLPPDKRKRRSGIRSTPPKPTISYVSKSTLAKLDFDFDDIVKDMNDDELKKCTAKIGDERFVCVARCPKIRYKAQKGQTHISVEKRRSEKLDNSLNTVVGGNSDYMTGITREGTKLRHGMVTTCLHDCMIRQWNTYAVVAEADEILAAIHAECKKLNARNKCVLVFVLNESGDGPAPNTLPVQKYEFTTKDNKSDKVGFWELLNVGGLRYEGGYSGQYEDLQNEGCSSWGGQFYVVRCSQDEYESTELAEDASALFSAGVTQLEKLHGSIGANQYTNNDGSTLHHIWVYTLTEQDTRGDSIYGVMTSSRYISKCVGSRGGRGSTPAERKKDSSFKDMEVGDGGREWKNTSSKNGAVRKFWIEKKEAKTVEWYRKKGIRVTPPNVDFSTLTATPLAELDLTD